MHRPRLLGVLAGDDFPVASLVAWAKSADVIIAADGAANRLLQQGISPTIIIGDMDSVDVSLLDTQIECIEVEDQETTDADKLLQLVANRWPGNPLRLVGLEGDRFDHVLANVQSVAKSSVETHMILRGGLGWILRPGADLHIPARGGDTLSAIALTQCCEFELHGVRWAPAGNIGPDGPTSISNECTGPVDAKLRQGLAFILWIGSTTEPHWSI